MRQAFITPAAYHGRRLLPPLDAGTFNFLIARDLFLALLIKLILCTKHDEPSAASQNMKLNQINVAYGTKGYP